MREATSELLLAIANSHRLFILKLLLGGEASVGELQRTVGLSQSALSQHLAKLRERGLVHTRRDAQTVYYSCTSVAVRVLLSTLDALRADGEIKPSKKFPSQAA